MCYFFSCLSDGNGTVKFIDKDKILSLIRKKHHDFNSHTYMAELLSIKEDTHNKWEYNPYTKELTLDNLATTDDNFFIKKTLDDYFSKMSKDEILELEQLFEDIICTYKDGKRNGKYESFYENGNKWEVCTYKDDNLNGKYESFYENGNKWVVCTYKDGKRNGKYESFYENGNKGEVCTYKDDNLNGKYESFYENGNKGEVCTYKDGKRNGKYESFYENGNKYEDYTYKDGIKLNKKGV